MVARPQRPCRLACLAASLLPCAAALRTQQLQAPKPGAPFRQELVNIQDSQYVGEMTIGGQGVRALLDTGSFELVVFSKKCTTCGRAGKYDQTANASKFAKGGLTQDQSYGSGVCSSVDGYDEVSVGGMRAARQAMWLATDCDMPILEMAGFNAVAGIGPPGEPVATAKQQLQVLRQDVQDIKAEGDPVPNELQEAIKSTEAELEAAKTKPSMLENLGVSTFSVCFGQKRGSAGWLVWNDETRESAPGVMKIGVQGQITWGVQAKEITLGEGMFADVMACREGCGSIVDTGTSLIAVPTDMYETIADSVTQFVQTRLPPGLPQDCSDLSAFPDMLLTLGGRKLRFPPSSYIGGFVGRMNKKVSQFVRLNTIAHTRCQLLMMDIGPSEITPFGPMIIIGMPLFREYYTTFSLGPGQRSLFLSPASETCEPPAPGAEVKNFKDRSIHATTARKIDVSTLRVPSGLKHLKGKF